jgi:RNase P protein component
MERWLSLTILESPSSVRSSQQARVHISVPKSTVKLAVTRNRLKRVLREAVRRDPFFGRKGVYCLRVHRMPRETGLAAAQKTLETLHD